MEEPLGLSGPEFAGGGRFSVDRVQPRTLGCRDSGPCLFPGTSHGVDPRRSVESFARGLSGATGKRFLALACGVIRDGHTQRGGHHSTSYGESYRLTRFPSAPYNRGLLCDLTSWRDSSGGRAEA